MTTLSNKIVTCGFGSPRKIENISGPLTLGFGPLAPGFVRATLQAQQAQHRRVVGQSGTKRRLQELDEVIVWAKLVSINERVPQRDIKGFVRVQVNKDAGYASVMAEHVSSRVKKAWESIRVTVKRLGRDS